METLIERIAALEERFERADCRYSAKRNRIEKASISSDNSRLTAIEQMIGINPNGEVVQND